LKKKVDEIFEDMDIILDGTHWQSCTFRRCNIIIRTGEFGLSVNNFDNCKLTIEGNAMNIVTVIEMFFPGKLPFNGDRPKY
jgi:hypothetical protein